MIDNFLSSFPYASTTKRTYADILTRFLADVAAPQSINAGQLTNWLEKDTGWGNARQRLGLACIRKYLAWAHGNLHPALSARIKYIEGEPLRSMTQEVVDILLASFDRHSIKGARDLAIASTLLQTGFRSSELCRLKQEFTNTEHGFAQVLVKGGKWRFGLINPDTCAHIEHWKRFRENINPQDGRMFVSLKSNCKGKSLTSEGLNRIIRTWGEKLEIEMSPHDFRRSLATIGSENGGNDIGMMEAGGWKSPDVYKRYTRNYRLESVRRFLPSTKLKETV